MDTEGYQRSHAGYPLQLYKSLQDYELALIGYHRAQLLDPTWAEPGNCLKGLLDYLNRMQDLTESKVRSFNPFFAPSTLLCGPQGKLKPKKLQSLVDSLCSSDLGPYAGGSFKGAKGVSVNLSPATIDELRVGSNEERVLSGKVVCSIQSEHSAAL